jgi:hypothetical protein
MHNKAPCHVGSGGMSPYIHNLGISCRSVILSHCSCCIFKEDIVGTTLDRNWVGFKSF